MATKQYNIKCRTKANGNEYFHCSTISAESIADAKKSMKEMIRASLDRHAFQIGNADANSVRKAYKFLADRHGWSYEELCQQANGKYGIQIYER